MSADPTKTNVGLEYFCTEDDEIWSTPDDQLLDLATRELASLGLTKPEEVIDGLVIRQPKAYPVYNEEYRDCVEQLQQYLQKIENLQTIGRNGMHRYNNMDHSMQTGILAARNLNGASHDLWTVNEEQEYLESGDAEIDVAEELPIAVAGSFARLDSVAFGAAAGCVSGLFLLVATLWLVVKGGPVVGPNLRLLAEYFPGYSVTVVGALLGFFYAGAVGFVGGWGFASLRDTLLRGFFVFTRRKAELFRLIDPSDRA